MRLHTAAFLAVLITAVSACQTTAPPRSGEELSLAQARRLSDSLSITLTEASVIQKFGTPTRTQDLPCETEASAAGSACRMLEYQWTEPDREARLQMMFRNVDGVWYLNSWQWR